MIDTIAHCTSCCQDISVCQLAGGYNSYSFIDTFLKFYLSPIVLILIFIVGRIIEFRITKKSNAFQFYISAVLVPNLDAIDEFIESYMKCLTDSVKAIKRDKGTVEEIHTRTVAPSLKELQSIKKKFDLSFLSMIRSCYPKKAVDLTNILNSFDDAGTRELGKIDLKDLDSESLKESLAQFKTDFYQKLIEKV
jgi:hypothetical protein